MLIRLALLSLFCSLSVPAWATDVEVSGAWVRGTVGTQKATGAFMELRSQRGASLVGASSPVAGVVELHRMSTEDGVMKMRQVSKLDIPTDKPLLLEHGGLHIMLMDLKKPLNKGDQVTIQLKLKDKSGKTETLDIKAEVKDLTAIDRHAHHH